MGFNKKYLPTKKELITILLENGSDDFYRGYVKTVDAYIGSEESMEFMSHADPIVAASHNVTTRMSATTI